MQLHLNLQAMSVRELTATSAFLQALTFGEQAQPAVASNTGSTEPVASPTGDPAGSPAQSQSEVVALPASTSEAVTEPKKRGRKPKEDVVTAEQAAAVDETACIEQPKARPITIDDLRAALQRFTAASGMPAGIELLKGFGCNRISELAEKGDDVKAAFIAKCPALEAA